MDITWLGHACFRIRTRDATVVMDPPGGPWSRPSRLEAEIVTISHEHDGHGNEEAVTGRQLVLKAPGEYESHDILILGIGTYHDTVQGRERGRNTVFVVEAEGMTLCHLGDLGHTLSAEQTESLGKVDILLVPVGGVTTLNASRAVETINLIEPKIVIPMHFQDPQVRADLEPVDKFLKEMGGADVQPQPRLSITRSGLPQEVQVVLLSSTRS